jgi:hypothetical protein
MYNYKGLKSALNGSPSAYTFGKSKYIGPVLPGLFEYSLVWDSITGTAYRRSLRVEGRSCAIENSFVYLPSLAKYDTASTLRRFTEKSGYYYSIQCGGSGNTYICVKTETLADESLLSINALNFLHVVGWIDSTHATQERPLSMALSLNSQPCAWMTQAEVDAKCAAAPHPPIHWVWFRKPGYKLTQEIVERAYSWIALNPKSTFHLWTDIPTDEDVADFLSNLMPEWRTAFLAATAIHKAEETSALIEEALTYFSDTTTADGIAALRYEFASTERQARVYKTDFARLFIIWKYGGIYTDFNDLLCLAPIQQIFAVYDPSKPLGVTDHADNNHATNYFLYTPAKHTEWESILRGMITDVPHLVRMIRDTEIAEAVLAATHDVLQLCIKSEYVAYDTNKLHTVFNRQQLPYVGNEGISPALWERLPYIILSEIAPEALRPIFRARLEFVRRNTKQRKATPAFQPLDEDGLLTMNDLLESQFKAQFLFWWTDFNLRTLMHYTNLPIYCRMRKIPLTMLPYGYYMSYSCMVSWVGHIGDGTSYGMDGRKDVRAADLYERAGCGSAV